MVYNVHLPTPRRELRSSRGGILLHRLTGRRQPAYDALQASWEGRVELAREFAALIDREQQPCIVAGDFNMPHSGYVYRVFSGHLQDAFGQAGRGFGYTLPGTTRNPLSLFGPWLRLDYIFCSSDFQIASARTEPTRKSQHRAVSAALVLRSSQNSHGEP
jgi:endonuclease/exonuclease/phosphatase (EEP) superfamily protein YafD